MPRRNSSNLSTVGASTDLRIFFLTYDFDAGDDEAPDIPVSYRYARGVRNGR